MVLAIGKAAEFSVHLIDEIGPVIDGVVDTSTDTFQIKSWTNSPGATHYWTPKPNQLPLTLRAYKLGKNALSFDVPDNWDGTMDGWVFALPVEQELGQIEWEQGSTTIWKETSFGWGGFRRGTDIICVGGRGGASVLNYAPVEPRAVGDSSFETVEITPLSTVSTPVAAGAASSSASLEEKITPTIPVFTLHLKNGETVTGRILSETPDRIVLEIIPGMTQEINPSDVVSRLP